MHSHITKQTRIELTVLLRAGLSLRASARILGVHHTSLVRELRRKQVLENTPDRLMAQAHKDIDSKLLVKSGLKRILRRNLVARAQAIAKFGLPKDVQSATKKGV